MIWTREIHILNIELYFSSAMNKTSLFALSLSYMNQLDPSEIKTLEDKYLNINKSSSLVRGRKAEIILFTLD